MYDDAVAVYQKAVDLSTKNTPKLKHKKKDLIAKEASLYSNMAACYKQSQHNKKEIEYCTKVIERTPYISDMNMLSKAYFRRGLSYESLEKLKLAKEDMQRVRELQPTNIEAQKALNRIQKGLQDGNQVDLHKLEGKLTSLKDQGNKHYGAKKFDQAIKVFTEGIDLYLQDHRACMQDTHVKTKVVQLYTNRALSYHQLND